MKVDDIAQAIVAREGGFVNDRDDPGGATKYGVTIGTMQRLGMDLNHDGKLTVADVRALTQDQAKTVFLKDYFERPRIAELPDALQASVFDMAVNAGTASVESLQRLLTQMGFPCAADGVIGPQTIAACAAAYAAAGDFLVDAYGIERRNFYYALADRRPASRKFARRNDGGKGGWITRAEEFISPKYRLSDADHKARVASWG
ncbi:MAG: holin-associated N-acetylmuramidase [Deltaproteobacteria bacterium]